jgi:hypothetical protein
MNIKTQCAQIRKVLEKGESLTAQDALNRFGCFRLAARIFDLKQDGMSIDKDMIPAGDTHVAEYRKARA